MFFKTLIKQGIENHVGGVCYKILKNLFTTKLATMRISHTRYGLGEKEQQMLGNRDDRFAEAKDLLETWASARKAVRNSDAADILEVFNRIILKMEDALPAARSGNDLALGLVQVWNELRVFLAPYVPLEVDAISPALWDLLSEFPIAWK
jgi:peptide subunit release factor RF-3